MKILLLNVPWVEGEGLYGVKAGARWPSRRSRKKHMEYYPYPFHLAYATAVLKKRGFEARLRDAIVEGMSRQALLDWAAAERPDVVVIETATPAVKRDLEFARRLKESTTSASTPGKGKDLKIVICGPHATALPEEILAEQAVDFVLMGEFDYSLAELCEALQGDGDPYSVRGVAFRRDGTVHRNELHELIQALDELPYPERDDVPILDYTVPFCKEFPNVCMLTSRGCPYSCIYCVEPKLLFGKKSYRTRSAKSVVDEMEHILGRYEPREIFFDDSSSTIDERRMRAICQEIRARSLDVKWSCMGDVRASTETLKAMVEAGCEGIFFGVESGSAEILKNIRKGITLDEVRRFTEVARRLGLYTHASYMFGLPGETAETIRATIDFAFSLPTTTAQFSIATPLPGTEFFELARREGWLRTEDWSQYEGAGTPVIQYPECSADMLVAAMEEVRKRRVKRMLCQPTVLIKYAVKTVRMAGIGGLIRSAQAKLGYLVRD